MLCWHWMQHTVSFIACKLQHPFYFNISCSDTIKNSSIVRYPVYTYNLNRPKGYCRLFRINATIEIYACLFSHTSLQNFKKISRNFAPFSFPFSPSYESTNLQMARKRSMQLTARQKTSGWQQSSWHTSSIQSQTIFRMCGFISVCTYRKQSGCAGTYLRK